MEEWRTKLKEQFPIDKSLTSKQQIEYAMNQLEESMFRFCCFVDMFNKYFNDILNSK